MSDKPDFEVGDVVYLTGYGVDVFRTEFEWGVGEHPVEGDTAVVKAVVGYGKWKNHEYVVEFFGWPGKEWGAYYGEIRSIHDR